ncbi:uncharacterized protein LOC124112732 isoform X2 [Haliotis rufescens]|uniref:uncharacterized protein LOC124112732 isoform X2 n=1 Tax=Haliotis rufescens TaxID=6454 RepID=UPI00201F8561|nr:uncharacterized protein LOC124112732 isoform X2 [Haliotis rufescens]
MHVLMCQYALWLLMTFLPHISAKTAELSPPVQVSTGCHGNTHGDFITPACANQSIIAASGVYAMVKKADTGCPEVATDADRDEEKCCTYNTRDCKLLYLASEMSFYEDCTGVYTCNMKVATQLTQGCNDVGYLLRSNYMMMEYYCIPRSLTLEGVEDASVSGTAVYVKSKDYPSGIPAGTEISCSIAASCDTPLVITAIHVDLYIDSSGICQQRLNIKDGNEEQQVDCTSNNGDNFKITEALTSKTHSLVISFLNNNSGNNGRYWFEIKAETNVATVTMTCGNDAASAPPTVDKCADNPNHSNRPAGVTEDPVLSQSNRFRSATIGLGSILGIVSIIMGVCLIIFCRKYVALKHQAKVGPPSSSADDSGGLEENCRATKEKNGGNSIAPTSTGFPPLPEAKRNTEHPHVPNNFFGE